MVGCCHFCKKLSSNCSGGGSCGAAPPTGSLRPSRSKIVVTIVISPSGRGVFLLELFGCIPTVDWIGLGLNRRFDCYNIAWTWFLTFGSQIRAHIDFDNDYVSLFGLRSGVGDYIQHFGAVDAVPRARLRVGHNGGQNVWCANDICLRALTFLCPRADPSGLCFLDCSDQLVIGAE